MIVALKGVAERVDPSFVTLDVKGVFYGVFVSLLSSMEIKQGEETKLLISEVIREDAYLLFGFLHKMEQQIFERLIKINGVGPKVAMAILSTFSPSNFAQIIETKNIQALQKVPGIGTKGASKIMVDLAGFFDIAGESNRQNIKEVFVALEGLGFKKSEIEKVLKKVKSQDTAGMIKEALQFF